jgi:hypothetical protein
VNAQFGRLADDEGTAEPDQKARRPIEIVDIDPDQDAVFDRVEQRLMRRNAAARDFERRVQ